MPEVVALYARVSSQRQKADETIRSQVEEITQFIREKDCVVGQELLFEDDGYSGSTLDRPELDRLRDLASEGVFTKVFALSPDRLCRQHVYQQVLLDELERWGVKVAFVKSTREASTPEEKLLTSMQGMFAEYERAQILERSRRGKLHKARQGSINVLSHAPYGYRYINKNAFANACFEVAEHEAEVVRFIFKLYTQDLYSISRIASELKANNINSPKGKPEWGHYTINRILSNPTYTGVAYYGKTRLTGKHIESRLPSKRLRDRGGRRPQFVKKPKPKDEWIPIKVPVIVEQSLFDRAQEILRKNKQHSPRNTKEPSLLQGFLVCGECGYSYCRYTNSSPTGEKKYYRCSNKDKNRRCKNRGIRREVLDDIVWTNVLQLIQEPQLVEKELKRRAKESSPSSANTEVLRVKKRIEKSQAESDRLLDAFQEGLCTLDELRERSQVQRRNHNTLQNDLKRLIEKQAQTQEAAHLAVTVSDFMAKLSEKILTADVHEKKKVLRLLVKEVIVGKEEIIIRHIVPVPGDAQIEGIDRNAQLRNSCQGG